jgi:chromosome segregation ATPase
VATKRIDESEETATTGVYTSAVQNSLGMTAKAHKDEDKVSQFWRVFGGTLLSIAALVAITMYNGMHSSITELRAEIIKLNEAKVDAAKKEDLATLRTQVTLLGGYRAEIDSLKERASKYRNEIEEAKKDTQARLELSKKERDDALETVRKDLASVEILKSKVNTTTTDLKLATDELQKVRQEVEKNHAADLERRDQRTAQMKAIDDTIKDIQKNLLESREKIARLEGLQSQSKSVQPARATETNDR